MGKDLNSSPMLPEIFANCSDPCPCFWRFGSSGPGEEPGICVDTNRLSYQESLGTLVWMTLQSCPALTGSRSGALKQDLPVAVSVIPAQFLHVYIPHRLDCFMFFFKLSCMKKMFFSLLSVKSRLRGTIPLSYTLI